MEGNKTMQDYLFDFAYGEALRDAINQQSFKGEKNYLYECETGKNEVRTYINAILNGEHPSFIDAEKKVEEQFNKFIKSQRRESNQVFSFGNTEQSPAASVERQAHSLPLNGSDRETKDTKGVKQPYD